MQWQPHYKNPSPDKLVMEGFLVTDFYSIGAKCSPTVEALMTGKSISRFSRIFEKPEYVDVLAGGDGFETLKNYMLKN